MNPVLPSPRPRPVRTYATEVTIGSKEYARRSRLAAIDTVLDYCWRHKLPAPADAVEFRRVDRLAFDETIAGLRAAARRQPAEGKTP